MLPKDKNAIDDRMLIQYLLGELPEEDAERLDELAVADDAVAARLNEVENQLVDAHVRGELSAAEEAPFRSFYLASPMRRAKVEFAAALVGATSNASPAARAQKEAVATTSSGWLDWLRAPHLALQWSFALAALLVAAVAGYLLLQNRSLVAKISQIQTLQATLDSRLKELQAQIEASDNAPVTVAPETQKPASGAIPGPALSAAILLLPQTRGASQPVAVLVEKGIASVPLTLALESSEFSRYSVTLKDPSSNFVMWSSGVLAPKRGANLSTIAVNIPAKFLKQQNYSIELSGTLATGSPDLAGTYAFHAVLR
jgi:anti-sigma factor RsiW